MTCPLIPMLAITGKPDREWIHNRLLGLRQGGIEQFLIYARSGCELKYLEKDWFDTCETLIQEAQSMNFSGIWIYDEFNWPSGQCHGKIQSVAPEYALQFLDCTQTPSGEWNFKVISAPDAGYPAEGKRESEEGGSRLGFPNLLNSDAVELFIKLTYEAYAEHFGPLFGTFIKGFFTDEPLSGIPGTYFPGAGGSRLIPYYPELEADYEARWNVPLRQDISNPHFAERCQKVVGARFRSNYLDRLRSWCDQHNLLLTGHLSEEWRMRVACLRNGDPMLAITGFSLPGCDEIYTKLTIEKFEWMTFGLAQYGIKKRGNGGIGELFAFGPADMPFARMKAMFNMAALFGIDHYFLAVSQLDFRGNIEKYGWFNPWSFDQPWWDKMPLLAEASKVARTLAGRKAAKEIAVRYPSECVEFIELLKMLVCRQIPWHFIGPDENCTDEPEVISPLGGGKFRLEHSGGDYVSLTELLAKLETIFQRKITVYSENGKLDENVFVRSFADGGGFIQDMSDAPESRKIMVQHNGTSVEYELGGRCSIELPAWEILRDRDNYFRVTFDPDGNFDFELEEPMRLKFAVRSYHGVEMELDGEKIVAESPAEWLPEGFRQLYCGCEIALEAGKHCCRKISGKDIYPYLPAAWITGDFAVDGNTLRRDLHDGKGLSMFSGILTQKAFVEIPRNAMGVSCNTDELVTELFINGESLGTCIGQPFFWSIPEQYRGKRLMMEIHRRISIAPIFGNVLTFRDYHGHFPDYYSGQYPVKQFVIEPEFKVL